MNYLATQTSGDPVMMIIMIVLVIAGFYFLAIRPQKKQEKEAAAMRNSIQVGDEITTIGGIIGKVISIKGETFVLETTQDKTKIRFLKGAVRNVDVKAADIAASVLETQTVAAEEVAEAPVETETNEENV